MCHISSNPYDSTNLLCGQLIGLRRSTKKPSKLHHNWPISGTTFERWWHSDRLDKTANNEETTVMILFHAEIEQNRHS